MYGWFDEFGVCLVVELVVGDVCCVCCYCIVVVDFVVYGWKIVCEEEFGYELWVVCEFICIYLKFFLEWLFFMVE